MKPLKINLKIIKAFSPCKDRLDNYVNHYSSKSFTLRQFAKLDRISHLDKLWVLLRLTDNDTNVIFALDCVFSATAYAAAATNAAHASAAANAAAHIKSARAYAAHAATAYAADAADHAADTATNAAATAADYAADAATYINAAHALAHINAAHALAIHAATAATYAADTAAEQDRQLESLIYLIEGGL